MRFISNKKDLRVIKGDKEKDSGVAMAIGKLTLMFSSLIDAIAKRPAPQVQNEIEVVPSTVDVKPEVVVSVPKTEPSEWMFEVDRDSNGLISRFRATPITPGKPLPRKGLKYDM